MQRLDHGTVRRMIAEREARAAHGQLVRTLARTTTHPATRLFARVREGLSHRVGATLVFVRIDRSHRRSHGAPSVPAIVVGSQRSAAPVGCV